MTRYRYLRPGWQHGVVASSGYRSLIFLRSIPKGAEMDPRPFSPLLCPGQYGVEDSLYFDSVKRDYPKLEDF